MKKKIFILLLMIISVISLTGCGSKNNGENENKKSDSLRFKEEYESINGQEVAKDKEKKYRELEIPSSNPFVYASVKDIIKMIDDEETFVVYFGFETCPWCRSIINNLIDAAKDNQVDKIYYVNVKNIRDELEYKNGKVVTKKKGMEAYYDLLEKLDSVLKKYELTIKVEKDDDDDDDDDKKEKVIDTKEKRIYAPNVIVVKKGKPVKLVTGISEDLKNPYDKLTDDINEDSYEQFEELLKEYGESGGSCSIKKDKKC